MSTLRASLYSVKTRSPVATAIGLVALAWTLKVDVVRLAGSIMPKALVSSVSDVTCSPPSSTGSRPSRLRRSDQGDRWIQLCAKEQVQRGHHDDRDEDGHRVHERGLSLIHISEPTRLGMIS